MMDQNEIYDRNDHPPSQKKTELTIRDFPSSLFFFIQLSDIGRDIAEEAQGHDIIQHIIQAVEKLSLITK